MGGVLSDLDIRSNVEICVPINAHLPNTAINQIQNIQNACA